MFWQAQRNALAIRNECFGKQKKMFWQSVFPGAGIHLGEREIYGLHGVIYFELQRALQNWIRRRHEVHRKEHQTNKTQDLVERQHFSSLIRTAIPTSTAPTTLNASLTQ